MSLNHRTTFPATAVLLAFLRDPIGTATVVSRRSGALLFCVLSLLTGSVNASPDGRWWNDVVQDRISQAGTNRAELLTALNGVATPRRKRMAFLIENMPEPDLQTLSARFLLSNADLAYDAWEDAPWRTNLTLELFLNDVLPYDCLNEARDPWQAEFREAFTPLILTCRTPAEAAQALNRTAFALFNVRYDTERHRPDQSPLETIATGMTSCTGLSIFLVDACRAIGVPARIAGTPLWSNMRGNHTWVEVWDEGWHFLGAAEPDDAGLDQAWFIRDAAEAKRDDPQHAIYATSFRRTDVSFPLVWLPGDTSVHAINVTDRYATGAPPEDVGIVQLSVNVVGLDGRRAEAQVELRDESNPRMRLIDNSRSESADRNDLAKVFLMGYSHGGYGAYAIGPKMPDRFAAIHASAAAPTDGETTAKTLRTTPFTAMVGELDSMYGRYERNLRFRDEIVKLRGARTDIYPVSVTIVPGIGHGGLPDRDRIADMYAAVRNPVPRELDWLMTDTVVHDFFWLHVARPVKQAEISGRGTIDGFGLTANEAVTEMTLLMDAGWWISAAPSALS